MNKEEYKKLRLEKSEEISRINKEISELRDAYIEHNKPASIDDNVRIILNGGRVVTGKVCSLGILTGDNVCITSYRPDKGY